MIGQIFSFFFEAASATSAYFALRLPFRASTMNSIAVFCFFAAIRFTWNGFLAPAIGHRLRNSFSGPDWRMARERPPGDGLPPHFGTGATSQHSPGANINDG